MAMESLVIGTLDQIALEGPQGMKLPFSFQVVKQSGDWRFGGAMTGASASIVQHRSCT